MTYPETLKRSFKFADNSYYDDVFNYDNGSSDYL